MQPLPIKKVRFLFHVENTTMNERDNNPSIPSTKLVKFITEVITKAENKYKTIKEKSSK